MWVGQRLRIIEEVRAHCITRRAWHMHEHQQMPCHESNSSSPRLLHALSQ